MDESFVCRPRGDAFTNADLPLYHTVINSIQFPVVRLDDVKKAFFPALKLTAFEAKIHKLGEKIHIGRDCDDL